jgi:hypothetical protein
MTGLSKPGWRAWEDIGQSFICVLGAGVNKGHAASEAHLHNGREARTKGQRMFSFFDNNSGSAWPRGAFNFPTPTLAAQRYAIVFSGIIMQI